MVELVVMEREEGKVGRGRMSGREEKGRDEVGGRKEGRK